MNDLNDFLTNERFLASAFIVSVALVCSAMAIGFILVEAFIKLRDWAIAKAEEDEFEDCDDQYAELYHEDEFVRVLPPKENIWKMQRMHFNTAAEMFGWLTRNIPNSIRVSWIFRAGLDNYDRTGQYEIEIEENWMRKTQ